MSDSEDTTCPLCMEEMDIIDRNFVPCPCGYRVCMWCWHHIKENMNGLCPACRLPYKEDPHAFAAVDSTEVIKKNKERKQKEKQERKTTAAAEQQQQQQQLQQPKQPAPSKGPAIDRKHLHNYRVVQRNLVYIIGIPSTIASEETLRKPEYFGQYGKIAKIVVHRNHTSTHATVSSYITFAYKEDAKAAIQALEGFWLDGHQIRASFGTTKYCNNFIRGVACNNPECVYLHELGEDEDRFTKEEIQAGYSKLMQQPGVVTGAGGPSGTGKRPTVESILPPPVFVQDPAFARKSHLSSSSTSPKLSGSASSDALEPLSLANDEKSPEQKTSDAIDETVSTPDAKGSSTSSSASESKAISDNSLTQDTKVAEEKATSTPPLTSSSEKSEQKQPQKEIQSKQTKKETPTSTVAAATAAPNTLHNLVSSASFNGLGNCAVFPVPVSSLTVSIWSNLLKSTSDDLKINPYALIALPVTELFELTIPPVDAACMSIWPKPMSYYCQGVSVNGITHAPAGQHVYYRSTGFQENSTAELPSQATPPLPLQQPQPQHPQALSSTSSSAQLQPTQRPSSGSSPARFYSTHQQLQQQQQPPPPTQNNNNAYGYPIYSGNSSNQQSQFTHHPHHTQPAIASLQQMFPSVNMAYGSSKATNPAPPPPSASSYHHPHHLNDPSLR